MTVLNIKSTKVNVEDMVLGTWYLAAEKSIGREVVVQLPSWEICGRTEVYLRPNHMDYDPYRHLRNAYELVKKVDEITVR